MSPVNQLVDAVLVLSVRTYAERHAHIAAELGRHGIAFEYVFEHDGNALDPAAVQATFDPSDLRAGHQSLVLKNIHAWQLAVARGWRRVLVLEDDAVLLPGFTDRFREAMQAADALPPGWMIFLGGLDTKVPDAYLLSRGPLFPLPVATTEACVHDLAAMQRRLEWLARHKVTQPVDHLMRRIDRECGIQQYWLRHPVVEQGSVLGLFDSVLDRQRLKHSRLFNILRNRWNKFQRRRLREWRARLLASWRRPSP